MISGRAKVISASLVLLLGALSIPAAARAAEPRPLDAPRLARGTLAVPPLPLEYHTQERAGIRLSYHPATGERVRALEASVSAIRAELSAELGRAVLRSVEIRVAASPVEMSRLAPAERLGGSSLAFTFRDENLVVLSVSSSRALDAPSLEGLLRHALAHLALDEAAGDRPLPPWFHEGFAAHLAGEDTFARARTLTFAALGRRLQSARAIEQRYPEGPPEGSIAEAQAADFARFLLDRPGRDRFAALLTAIREGATFDAAFVPAYGESREQIELAWRSDLARRYAFAPVLLGATLAWVLVALVLVARRAARRRALAAAESAPRPAGESRRAARPVRTRPTRLDDEAEALAEPIVPEPEVPKIEHDGRWHTLH